MGGSTCRLRRGMATRSDWVISSTPGMADSTKLYHDAVAPMHDTRAFAQSPDAISKRIIFVFLSTSMFPFPFVRSPSGQTSAFSPVAFIPKYCVLFITSSASHAGGLLLLG